MKQKCLKTAKEPGVGGLILQLFLPSLHKCSHSCGFQRFSFETSQHPDSISLSGVFSMSPVTLKNHKKTDFFSLSSFPFAHSLQSHIFFLCLLRAGNGAFLVSNPLHDFLYKSVAFNNCIIYLSCLWNHILFLELLFSSTSLSEVAIAQCNFPN